jgi:hypothetical protein
MTPDRLESLAMRVRTVAENKTEHAGLCAWEPSRPYLFGENSRYAVRPVHSERHVIEWQVTDSALGHQLVRSANTFGAAVAEFL